MVWRNVRRTVWCCSKSGCVCFWIWWNKWFDTMCEEPFLVRKETFLRPQWVRSSFGLFVGKKSAAYQLSHYRCTVTNENVLPLHLRLCAVLSFRLTFPVVCCFHCETRSGEPRTLIREHLYGWSIRYLVWLNETMKNRLVLWVHIVTR